MGQWLRRGCAGAHTTKVLTPDSSVPLRGGLHSGVPVFAHVFAHVCLWWLIPANLLPFQSLPCSGEGAVQGVSGFARSRGWGCGTATGGTQRNRPVGSRGERSMGSGMDSAVQQSL